MDIHVGNLIKTAVQKSDIPVIKFASNINTTRENVYGIFKRKTIDTGLLMRICETLNYNFFEDLSMAANETLKLTPSHKNQEAAATNNEESMEYIKRENELLKDVIRLMKDKYEK